MQPRQRRLHRPGGGAAFLHLPCHEMGDHLGIGLGRELGALLLELLAQLAIVLDDAVVDDRKPFGGVRMGIAFARLAVRRPACMPDPDRAFERFLLELELELVKLAFGAAAREAAAFKRGAPRRVVTAIRKLLQRVDELHRDRPTAEYADDPAHGGWSPTRS